MCTCFECVANLPEPTDAEIIQNLQTKLDEKDKELADLRGFAEHVLRNHWCLSAPQVSMAKKYGLIDENGNSTKLLMGE